MHRALRMLVASIGRILHDADSSEAGPFVGMSIKSRWTSYDMSHGDIDEGNITFWLPKPTTGCAGDALKPFGKEFDTDFRVSVNSKIHTPLKFPDHDSDEGPTCIRILKVLDKFYPLSAIKAIRIDFRQPFAYKDWVSFLKRMPNVRRLYVHGDYEGNTCSLWSVLGRIFIDTRETQGSSPFWLALLGMLFRRAKAGNAVQFLRIDASWDNAEPLKKCQIQRLKDFVSSFEYEIHNWDVNEVTEPSAYSFLLSREWDDSNAFEARLPLLSLDSDVEALSSDGEWSDGGDDDDGDGDGE
ncbi:hypothetical protein OF83DRAFT_1175946 [Amylostereum chailletii]|nr:hypothetical protein OF83DRAFT_1175946 [Amylostereum chailletii]